GENVPPGVGLVDRPGVRGRVFATLQSDYVALLGQRDADISGFVGSLLSGRPPAADMALLPVPLPQGIDDDDEFRAMLLNYILDASDRASPQGGLGQRVSQAVQDNEGHSLKYRLRTAFDALGRNTSARPLVIVFQALPTIPYGPLKNLLLILRDYYAQRNTPGTPGYRLRFLATGEVQLWRLCYYRTPDQSPFNIAERVWLGGLSPDDVRNHDRVLRLDRAVKLQDLTGGAPALFAQAYRQPGGFNDVSRVFGAVQDHWNALPEESRRALVRIALGTETFPECELDSRCPNIPELDSPVAEAFWAGFLRIRHRRLSWRSPIHRSFVMHQARMEGATSRESLVKLDLADRVGRLKRALNDIEQYTLTDECLDEILALATHGGAIELVPALDLLRRRGNREAVARSITEAAGRSRQHWLRESLERAASRKKPVAMLAELAKAAILAIEHQLGLVAVRAPARRLAATASLRGHSAAAGATADAVRGIVNPAKEGRPPATEQSFDAFLSYHSDYKAKVEQIAEQLRSRGLKLWLDQEQVPPGRWFQDYLEGAIVKAKSVVIFIGRKGLGRWQAIEVRAFVQRCAEENIPVIPVLLPGIAAIPEELMFLRSLNRVRFVKKVSEPDPLDRLVWGIRDSDNKQ
ncbi:MAG TPA: toll/interleukin-1 receptor domain-containing protein, partial [Isosphaeraceae bacterium]|nr:toll/interleukin-1 receptor domain-containing protein [Isosphaeraceae bacterium]